ncbi:polygalacturonase-like [Impatiens glandulifera]|uniref:polygalacturonase-like n=1 Tax=Impatiens glandulifera TaxID=253017 RepID=UPI001FB15090|nr:polygalacturonase-like [Impatiens glandulifera]
MCPAVSDPFVFQNLRSLSPDTVNVEDFVDKGNMLDDTEGFKKAWIEVCNSTSKNVLLIPKHKTYHIKRINFTGPCNSLVVKMEGRIKASNNFSDYEKDRKHWIIFKGIDNLKVKGKGTFDGNGEKWWQNSCKVNHSLPCVKAPTAVTFKKCNNLIVEGVRFENSQQMHVTFQQCVNVRAKKLRIFAPKTSPNTDGIHITGTKNIWIDKPYIRTGKGDDCISIVNGSTNVKATNVRCGPGHGISIGSLGKNNSEAQVSNVLVRGAKLKGTTNGVRIKTWQGGKGYVKDIVFKNIIMHNVSNPIIIDQNYCDQDDPCPEQVKNHPYNSEYQS